MPFKFHQSTKIDCRYLSSRIWCCCVLKFHVDDSDSLERPTVEGPIYDSKANGVGGQGGSVQKHAVATDAVSECHCSLNVN